MKGLFVIGLTVFLFSCDVPEPVSDCTSEVSSLRWTSIDQTQLQADIQIIDAYLDAHGITAVEHPSGVRYVITQAGTGDNLPCLENAFSVTYEGRLLSNNTIFDATDKPTAFVLGSLIGGWQVAFLNLNKGAKATIYIPSGLAYGTTGRTSTTTTIPPNAR
jgi:FKBP-type peptidyl-prolyl cis-trans isomerase FkpA